MKPKLTLLTSLILAPFAVLNAAESNGNGTANAGTRDNPKPQEILALMQKVGDWQLANPSKHHPRDWTQGAGYTGIMALSRLPGGEKYQEAMRQMGEVNNWAIGVARTKTDPGDFSYNADDHCVGQTYLELYQIHKDPRMLAGIKKCFDFILENPPGVETLKFNQPNNASWNVWSWCDSLFMAPPAWVDLYNATGDKRYLDFAVNNWWRTTDYLYNTKENLFFRDDSFFDKTEANGRKVFWGRGNGWVMGGLARMLDKLPANHPDRARFERLFKEMAAKIVTCQQPDGLWRASLLDPNSYPLKETSGSAFYTFALAWGVNRGLLDRATYAPAALKGWAALGESVNADGKLTHVQPIGEDPKNFPPEATEIYGVGAFLLAGSEIYRMQQNEANKPAGTRSKVK